MRIIHIGNEQCALYITNVKCDVLMCGTRTPYTVVFLVEENRV